MEKFLNLPEDKQKRITDAAFYVFGNNVYKKASTGDIATVAGISKGMIFHYFGSKKELYLYLLKLCGEILTAEQERNLDKSVTDFFDRIKMSSAIKIATLKEHPHILSFINHVHSETDSEVAAEIKTAFSTISASARDEIFDGVDYMRFKNPEAPELLMKLLIWAGMGVADSRLGANELDECLEVYTKCLDLMKENFYYL